MARLLLKRDQIDEYVTELIRIPTVFTSTSTNITFEADLCHKQFCCDFDFNITVLQTAPGSVIWLDFVFLFVNKINIIRSSTTTVMLRILDGGHSMGLLMELFKYVLSWHALTNLYKAVGGYLVQMLMSWIKFCSKISKLRLFSRRNRKFSLCLIVWILHFFHWIPLNLISQRYKKLMTMSE